MGYNPNPTPAADQWTADDLARAEAAQDWRAIDKARRAGQLHTILNPSTPGDGTPAAPPPPAGPTVPGQQPGAAHAAGGAPAQMSQDELDRLAAAGDWSAINQARRDGRLRHLGA